MNILQFILELIQSHHDLFITEIIAYAASLDPSILATGEYQEIAQIAHFTFYYWIGLSLGAIIILMAQIINTIINMAQSLILMGTTAISSAYTWYANKIS